MAMERDGPLRDDRLYCHVRYEIDRSQADAFDGYARTWIELVERHGGQHHGYYLCENDGQYAADSTPGPGRNLSKDVAIALFSFPDRAAHDAYRQATKSEASAIASSSSVYETRCIRNYERGFFRRINKGHG